MRIGILNIGDEVLDGRILNTNHHAMARFAKARGHEIGFACVLGDDISVLTAWLQNASIPNPSSLPAVDLLLVSGGLGPTVDDLTREAFARALKVPLEENTEAMQQLADFLHRSVEELPEGQKVQALLPLGVRRLLNPTGTACGVVGVLGSVRVLVFPGVPREVTAMLDLLAAPLLEISGTQRLRREAWTFGLSESQQRECFKSIFIPEVFRFSSLPQWSGVWLSLEAVLTPDQVAAGDRAQKKFEKVWDSLLERIPESCLVDKQGLSLVHKVHALLLEKKAKVSVAESCTGGTLGHLITGTPGSSALFDEGYLTYANQAKINLLGVPESLLQNHGAVSEEVAFAMAEGARKRSGSDYALSVTGIAGPDGGTEEKPVGTVWVGIAGPQGTHTQILRLRGDRDTIRWRAAYSALNVLRLTLLEKTISSF
jgi:nicotinamide-nucleotide amidase